MDFAEIPKARQQMRSLSPFQKDFAEFLDPKISKLVLRLIRAGHFVLYSCEGHALTEPRYVTLAFASDDQRWQFINDVGRKIGRGRVSFVLRHSLSTEVIGGKEYVYETPQSEVRGINHLYRQNHDRYFFVIMRIGKSLSGDVPEQKLSVVTQAEIGLRNLYYSIYNFLNRDRITKRLGSLF